MTKPKPKAKKEEEVKEPQTSIEYISLDLIDDPEQPMRSDMTEASVEDLVLSIKQVGIIEPIIVRAINGRYQVIAGHRRTFAARLAKIMEAPCIVRSVADDEVEMIKIHENLYRADIKPADEAKHFDYLIQKKKMSPAQIASIIGKSLSYVTDRLDIISYHPFLREAMDKGDITFSVAREFHQFNDDQQMMRAVHYARVSGMTQAQARKWVTEHKRAKETPQITTSPNASGNGQSATVEHLYTCAFCRGSARLSEIQILYGHPNCFAEFNRVVDKTPDASADEVPH